MKPLEVFDPAEVLPLEQRHRDAMLDVILAWGKLDGVFGMLHAAAEGRSLSETAAAHPRMPVPARLKHVRTALKAGGSDEAARLTRRFGKLYDRLSETRNTIAHSNCLGVWRPDRDFILFTAFEAAGPETMAGCRIPIGTMRQAALIAQALVVKISSALDARS